MPRSAHLFTLPSGLRCVFWYQHSPVAYCALTALAGTRYEAAGHPGLAHLAEHLLFKGTVKRRAWHINNRLERLGGELNAFTSKEEMTVQATVLHEDLPRALDLLADLAFHSQVPAHELEKEKTVVADEIRSYKDSPAELIYDEFEEDVFGTSPLARNILGNLRSLQGISRQDLLDFYAQRFRPQNMVLSVVGRFSTARIEALAARYFGQAAPAADPAPCPVSFPDLREQALTLPPTGLCAPPFQLRKKRNTHQLHCLIGAPAYHLYRPERVAMSLLMNHLGGPASNAKLNMVLREKHGLVYNVEAFYNPYSDAGYAGIYFGTDKEAEDRCLELIRSCLHRLSQDGLSTRALEQAKKQYIGQLAIADTNGESLCLHLAKSVLYYNRVPLPNEGTEKLRAVTVADLVAATQLLLDPRQSVLTYY